VRRSTLDEIDIKLLTLLQEDGRKSQHDLAEAVRLSSPATGERLKKLEERGIIRQFTALVDAKKLGRDVTAFVAVGIDGSRYYGAFVEHAQEHPDVLECHAITGQGSHLLKIRTQNTSTLEHLLSQIQSWPGVHWTQTNIVLSVLKETSVVSFEVSRSGAE
jgi:Lrp/AsnC family transcriptional regulator, leucine-responsive regulatory protein